jgi:hypothetical protein
MVFGGEGHQETLASYGYELQLVVVDSHWVDSDC